MIDTQNTDETAQQRRAHSLKAGDTPALGMPVEPGTGGRRRAYTLGIDVAATAEITLDDDVLWHEREAVVTEVYPAAHDWTRTLCKIQFADGGSVVVGRDELQLVQADGARYFVSVVEPDLADTMPLPSPVPRASAEVPTEHVPAVEAFLEEDGPTALQPAVGTLPAAPVVRHVGAFEGIWFGLLDVLRIVGAFLSWPFRRDGGRDLAGWIVDQVADGVEAAADWERWHSRLIAKVIVGALSGLVLAGLGAAWLIRAGVFA